ncbi:sulfatase family protein [Haloferula sp.]|uniref:sulfatase family protein n=1 Tax=Haloferula sp. TaxID=2497595 RepID=UPI003C74B674
MKILLLSLAFLVPSLRAAENFIVILADDLGYGDLGCYGSGTIKTPNLDRLATEGRKFTDCLVPSSLCSPSRAGLLTACYPKRVGLQKGVLFPLSKIGLNPAEFTIADYFKSLDYATACIGKWHLGHLPEVLPRANGFDYYYGIPYSNDMNHPDNSNRVDRIADESWLHQDEWVKKWNTPLIKNEEIIELPVNQRTITRRYTDKAIDFVRENKAKPFFLYLPHSMPHVPLFVPEDATDPDPKNAYKAVVEHLDKEIGRLVDEIRSLGLSERTWIIFTSDNGPAIHLGHHGGLALPLRGGKGASFEGGQRVPLIVWAPGRVPAGTSTNNLITTIDLLPSLASLSGEALPDENLIDGMDLSHLLTAEDGPSRTEFLYYGPQGDLEGIRKGDWKLRKTTRDGLMLFNLAEDIRERKNLAKTHPEMIADLTARMKELDAEVTAGARPVWTKGG